MIPEGVPAIMQLTLTISDAIIREAQDRNLPVIDFVESLIDKGLSAERNRPTLNRAIERIRTLRTPGSNLPPGGR
jgi:hypothetical protein